MTGAVASERVSEALKGLLRMVGNHPESAKAEGYGVQGKDMEYVELVDRVRIWSAG